MAEKKKALENEKTKETKGTSKKIATGSTQKIVQKRSSSVAGKKKTTTTKTAAGAKSKTDQTKSTAAKSTTKKTTSKTTTAKKTTTKSTTSKPKKLDIAPVLEEETKEVFNSILRATNQDVDKIVKKELPKKTKKDELTRKEMAEIQAVVEQEMKANKKIPEMQLNKMATRIFRNIFFAIVMMIYFNFIILGFLNIENSVFVVDLKVFSVTILVFSLGILEYAYKKKSGMHAIHGIEFLMLSLVTLSLIYVNLVWTNKFIPITILISYIFAIYYIAKSMRIYSKMKKQYFVETMKEIIRK